MKLKIYKKSGLKIPKININSIDADISKESIENQIILPKLNKHKRIGSLPSKQNKECISKGFYIALKNNNLLSSYNNSIQSFINKSTENIKSPQKRAKPKYLNSSSDKKKRLKQFILEKNKLKLSKQRCLSQRDLTDNQKNEDIFWIKEEELKLKEKKKKDLLKRSGRLRSFKNIKEYINSNGFSLNNFLEKNPIRLEPYAMCYGEEFLRAVKYNKISIVDELLREDPNLLFEHDYMTQNAFHWAAKFGYSELIQVMLKYGKCCNLFDFKKRIPLHYAAAFNWKECVKIFLEHGANPEIQDIDGKTPADLTENSEIKHILQSYTKKNKVEDKMKSLFMRIRKLDLKKK